MNLVLAAPKNFELGHWMRHNILSFFFCALPFAVTAAVNTDSANAGGNVTSNEKGVEKITIEGAATANDKPVGTFNSPISNLEYDPRVDLQSRNMAEAQADVTIRGGIFENMFRHRDSPDEALKLDDGLGVHDLFQLRFLVVRYAAHDV